MVIVTECDTGVTRAHVLVSHNHGLTWTASTFDPYAANTQNLGSVVCFKVGDGSETRVIVSRATADGGAPDIAWSDDWGESAWNVVDVGVLPNDYIGGSGGLFALDHRHIWAVTHLGDIWFSEDGGMSWTEQMPGLLGAVHLNYVRFVNEKVGLAVGDGQTVLYTVDGGVHWNVVDGPGAVDLLCCEIFDEHRAWVGDSAGALYYTNVLRSAGMAPADWDERVLPMPVEMTDIDGVTDIMFVRDSGVSTNDHVGFVTVACHEGSNHYGALYRTFNGGEDWEVRRSDLLTTLDVGLLAVWACEVNEAFAIGDETATTAYIMTVNGALP